MACSIVLVADLLVSMILGFMHGGVFGYFVGVANIAMLVAGLLALGFLTGKNYEKNNLRSWIRSDDKRIRKGAGVTWNDLKNIPKDGNKNNIVNGYGKKKEEA